MVTADIWIEPPRVSEGELEHAAVFAHGGERRRLAFRFPPEDRELLSARHDPFVIGFLFTAMRLGGEVRVHGAVSASLLARLEELQEAWTAWRPGRYRTVAWRADRELPDEAADVAHVESAPAICAFSGGVDACFTALRHRRGLAGRGTLPVQAAVMVHGLDIPLGDRKAFEAAFANSAAILADLDLPLHWMRTDFRALDDDWEDACGAAACACLSWYAGGYGRGLLGSSEPYAHPVIPWGSTPFTDPLFSGGRFRIVHDGAGYSRSEKVRTIARWPAAMARLRVCWAGTDKSRNCGRCEKCIRTALNFRAVGVDALPFMPQPIDDERILHLRGLTPLAANEFRSIVRTAEAEGIRAPWLRTLRRTLKRNALGIRWGGTLAQRIRSKLIDWCC